LWRRVFSLQSDVIPGGQRASQFTYRLARYAKHNGNFVLVVSGSLEAQRTKKFIEIVYNLLIKAVELRSFALLKFGVGSEGLK